MQLRYMQGTEVTLQFKTEIIEKTIRLFKNNCVQSAARPLAPSYCGRSSTASQEAPCSRASLEGFTYTEPHALHKY